MVANYAPDVGYAWWLMEHYWVLLAEKYGKRRGDVRCSPIRRAARFRPPFRRHRSMSSGWISVIARMRAGGQYRRPSVARGSPAYILRTARTPIFATRD